LWLVRQLTTRRLRPPEVGGDLDSEYGGGCLHLLHLLHLLLHLLIVETCCKQIGIDGASAARGRARAAARAAAARARPSGAESWRCGRRHTRRRPAAARASQEEARHPARDGVELERPAVWLRYSCSSHTCACAASPRTRGHTGAGHDE